jgi:hypothetical protein
MRKELDSLILSSGGVREMSRGSRDVVDVVVQLHRHRYNITKMARSAVLAPRRHASTRPTRKLATPLTFVQLRSICYHDTQNCRSLSLPVFLEG